MQTRYRRNCPPHSVIAGLDTLLIALYADLNDRIIPTLSPSRPVPSRPGPVPAPSRPAEVTNAELVCPAVAQVLPSVGQRIPRPGGVLEFAGSERIAKIAAARPGAGQVAAIAASTASAIVAMAVRP